MWTDDQVAREVQILQRSFEAEIRKLEESHLGQIKGLRAKIEELSDQLDLAESTIAKLKRAESWHNA